MKKQQLTKRGVVSIFVVIFTTLLVTIIAVSFVRLMLLDQQRAINADLADSAYDSALTGVEDAKRALLFYEREICNDTSGSGCQNITNTYLRGSHCGAVQAILGGADVNSEVLITSNVFGGGEQLDQAYTCVKIKYHTDNYIRDLEGDSGEQIILPLNFTADSQEITLSWHDSGKDIATGPLNSFSIGSKPTWPSMWNNVPPTLMVQYLDSGSAMPTLFLRPSTNGSSADFNYDVTDPSNGKNAPVQPVKCDNVGAYRCVVSLRFPNVIKAGDRQKFLKITKIYSNKTTLNFAFNQPGVGFNGIQPEIDSTGRANYIVRRVKARVEFTAGNFPVPSASLNVGDGGLTKDFEVTERHAQGESY